MFALKAEDGHGCQTVCFQRLAEGRCAFGGKNTWGGLVGRTVAPWACLDKEPNLRRTAARSAGEGARHPAVPACGERGQLWWGGGAVLGDGLQTGRPAPEPMDWRGTQRTPRNAQSPPMMDVPIVDDAVLCVLDLMLSVQFDGQKL